ncbi:MAG: GtrA family protein [Pelotomaculum sp.]|uniref:Predicted membrane protein n=1 Tax=Pelotomaculum thermopropionicum (strain DSM 13744 / JCM 10971 / SI) TaxID=370438 RepID=A5D277_PELTS|nr:GtrA family protein [Pelotomaculum sp.]BAF59646.1 predicted membrane protein [Pelotomaculum thermopropionicum SI]
MIAENMFQLCKFAAVGCVNTFIDWAVYFVILKIFPAESALFYSAAKAFSYFCGVVNSFFLNRCWTFKGVSDEDSGFRFVKFVLVNTAGVGINSASIYMFLIFNMDHALALFFATFIAFIFNFTLNKLWVFRKGKLLAKTTEG